MRHINEHQINSGNSELTITVLDEPGHGGANHAYDIEGGEAVPTHLRFQNGPIGVDGNGVNGITHEVYAARMALYVKQPRKDKPVMQSRYSGISSVFQLGAMA